MTKKSDVEEMREFMDIVDGNNKDEKKTPDEDNKSNEEKE
jgi:hypothetical protein